MANTEPTPRCAYCQRPTIDLIACVDRFGDVEYRCPPCADDIDLAASQEVYEEERAEHRAADRREARGAW